MLKKQICVSVLSVGCPYKNVRGGVAQVMNTYSKYVFNPFHCVVNSSDGYTIVKLFVFIKSLVQTFFLLLINRRIKILHIHTASYNSFYRSAYWIRLGKFFHKKVVLHIHGGGFKDFYATNPVKIKYLLDECDCLIALSESWREFFVNELHCQHVEVVGNIVPNPEKCTLNKEDSKFHLLFLGLIHKNKGIFDLLEAIAEQDKEWQSHILLHVGGNGEAQELKDQIVKLGLDKSVVYEGFVTGHRKTYLLNLCDAFILPSYVEGVPISILEAMSYAKPILSTPVGGIPEIVKNGYNGFLFNPGDKNSIVQTITDLSQNENLRHFMGKNSLTKVQQSLPNEVSKKLSSIYNCLLN